ncbi:MAG: phosphodiester glycosidase family protein [Saprospiraceae bacterium]
MKLKLISCLFSFLLLTVFCSINTSSSVGNDENILSYIIDLEKQHLQFFHKNQNGDPFINHGSLKKQLESNGQKLLFAMNGGMYNKDLSPQGLYIEDGKKIAPLDTLQKGYGNFYLQPNGVFYLTEDKKSQITTTDNFTSNNSITFATQSGPMLLIDGSIHPKFRAGSSNLHIRNGVGILPDGRLLFAMSKERINFFDFASFFKSQGCKNALYLDGFVSRTYLPAENWNQLDGKYGIIIAEIE